MQFTDDGQRISRQGAWRPSLTLVTIFLVLAAGFVSQSSHDGSRPAFAGQETAASTRISAAPNELTVGFGQTAYTGYTSIAFTVDIVVTDASSLDGWQAVLIYDPDLLAVDAIAQGDFLTSTGRTETGLGLHADGPGRTMIGGYTFGTAPAPSGSGLLARLTLRGLTTGTTAITLAEVVLTSSAGAGQVAVQTVDVSGAMVEIISPVAVLLASFDAETRQDGVLLSWETVSELDTQGFNLRRDTSSAGSGIGIAFVPAQAPGSTQGFPYQWLDTDVVVGETYYYWLDGVSLSGATTSFGPLQVEFMTPTAVTIDGLAISGGQGFLLIPWLVVSVCVVMLAWWLRRSRLAQ
jgi:hypothetical protein